MLITLKHKKKLRSLWKNKVYGEKHSFIESTYVVGAHWNCLYTISFVSLNHLKLPISFKIPVTIWQIVYILYDSYITKFDSMNYAFAKLVVAWL